MKDYFLDENHINADTEIDLVELFFTLLRHWKMVLCSALAGGILYPVSVSTVRIAPVTVR